MQVVSPLVYTTLVYTSCRLTCIHPLGVYKLCVDLYTPMCWRLPLKSILAFGLDSLLPLVGGTGRGVMEAVASLVGWWMGVGVCFGRNTTDAEFS